MSKIANLALFNLVHININLPPYVAETGISVEFNREWLAQSISNVATSFSGYPTYFVGATSILMYRFGGYSRISTILGSIIPVILSFILPCIQPLVPKIMAATILFYISACFIHEFFVSQVPRLSLFDLLLVMSTAFTCYLVNQVLGFICCILICSLIVISYYSKSISTGTRSVTEYEKIIMSVDGDTEAVIRVDYILCFATLPIFKSSLSQIKTKNLVLDLSSCQYIDMNGNDFIISSCSSFDKLTILGRPQNLYMREIEKNGKCTVFL
jgi:MFS superfamily sulfate permease-like transporter